jgi:hypothetical protein
MRGENVISQEREQLLLALEELGRLHPEMRLGQLIEAITVWASETKLISTYDVTDAELLVAARAHIQARRAASAATP